MSRSKAADSAFYVLITGQVESAEFSGVDNLYCRYAFSYGVDWVPAHGVDNCLSQIARRNTGGADPSIVWNIPVDIAFRATNAYGWPRIAIVVFGIDALGRDVVQGYGSVLVPTVPGQHERIVHMYAPLPSSVWQRFTAWLSGTPAEFYDAKFVARGEHRDVTRVRATGLVKVQLNVLTKGMRDFGYSVGEGAGMSTGETLNLSDAMLAGGGAASGVSFGSRS